ncbi:MAG: hypothetical protein NVSMB29_10910 [Candidatus Dormibacteria bacterium]
MLIGNATAEVHSARVRHRREMVERTRLRRLVERIDRVIESCEETHLQGIKEVPDELRAKTDPVFTFARRAVRLTGNEPALRAVVECTARRQLKITEVMDALWSIQEIVFDLMLPWRTELPEDVELPGAATAPWRYDAA